MKHFNDLPEPNETNRLLLRLWDMCQTGYSMPTALRVLHESQASTNWPSEVYMTAYETALTKINEGFSPFQTLAECGSFETPVIATLQASERDGTLCEVVMKLCEERQLLT